MSNSLQPHGLTIAYQAPPSMGFSRQEYWGGLPFPSPGDLPDPGIEPESPALKADALLSEPPGKASEAVCNSGSAKFLKCLWLLVYEAFRGILWVLPLSRSVGSGKE